MTIEEIIDGNEALIQSIANKLYKSNSVYSVSDLTQVGYLALCKSAKKYDPSRSAVTTFITHCVRNEMIKYIRKNGRVVSHLDKPTKESYQVNTEEYELDELENTIKSIGMNSIQEKIVRMRLLGMSYSQISKEADIPIGRVRKITRQIKKKASEAYA